jgi:hypothetical protein
MRKLFFLFLTLLVSSVFIPAASAEPIAYTISAPNLIDSTFKPSGNLDFAFSLSTNNPTSEPVYCYIDAFINPFEATRVSGTSKNGNYSCRSAIPEKPMELFPDGRYPLNVLVVYFDEFGKQELRQTFGYISFPTPTPTPTPKESSTAITWREECELSNQLARSGPYVRFLLIATSDIVLTNADRLLFKEAGKLQNFPCNSITSKNWSQIKVSRGKAIASMNTKVQVAVKRIEGSGKNTEIKCYKNGIIKIVSGIKPKCPKGFTVLKK